MPVRKNLKVTGVVQGVGFRPFVYQLASKTGISGWVANTSEGVVIEAEGDESSLDNFMYGLRHDAPRLAKITGITTLPIEAAGDTSFVIRESNQAASRIALIPADVALCDACAREIIDPYDRRFGYPFTNCTDCGPRFTIIRDIPYDRPKTTMSAFEMCPECSLEYHNPLDRRFHAQPNACPLCGPRIWLESGLTALPDDLRYAGSSEVIQTTARLLSEGRIVALKGLGGFHLACDAKNGADVAELRRRKGRGRKPFAVMVRDIDVARRICNMTVEEEAILLSNERPIVLLEARAPSDIASEVAPDNKYLGVMLPYTPLHHLLLAQCPDALVMTSGNLSEEPIACDNTEAKGRLAHIADAFLMHDRDIHVSCDDSVVRPVFGVAMPIRRARGFVPGAIDIGSDCPPIIACGAEQKNTFCITAGRSAIPSQHIGDADSAATMDYYGRAVEHLARLYDVKPEIVAHDLHPDYQTTRLALTIDASRHIAVQHHHAHAASCMAENGITGPALAVVFDGTGYGTDGRIWGGEFLAAELSSFKRLGHLRYVPMPGGAAAIRRPERMALSYLIDADCLAPDMLSFTDEELSIITRQIERGIGSPLTSSMGRLFDGVSALLGLCRDASYEGEPAAMLEMCVDSSETGKYDFSVSEADPAVIDTRPMIRAIVNDIALGVPESIISARFHNAVVGSTLEMCARGRDALGLNDVVLSGGCFQNKLLIERTIRRLEEAGFRIYTHHIVPPNDGGISLGQAAIGAALGAALTSDDGDAGPCRRLIADG